MSAIDGQPILTAAAMRAAERRAVAAGTSIATLMENAGARVAETTYRLSSGASILIVCGRGNNGGDGYVAARVLKANGANVRVASIGQPTSDEASRARALWDGPEVPLFEAVGSPVLVDALFGTGLSRPIAQPIGDRLSHLIAAAQLSIAVDLPSGLHCDTGETLSESRISCVDVTLALGAVKPVHVLARSSGLCGSVKLVDIGVALPADWDTCVIARPSLGAPTMESSKYTRGMVVVIGGAMPGAAALAAEAVLRSGAGYSLLLTDEPPAHMPHAVVRRPWSVAGLNDPRIGAIVVGPGLGRDVAARKKLRAALATDRPLVIDGDALHLLKGHSLKERAAPTILTPHGGEFRALFGDWSGSKIDAARDAAERIGAVVVFKGADTIIADTNGRIIVAPHGPGWLSTAGTGDVLAGAIGAMLTTANIRRIDNPASRRAFGERESAGVAAAVWLHAEAARRLGGAFIADDLARALSAARAGV